MTKIKEVRLKLGLTIKEVAAILNAPFRTVQSWNDGTRKPPPWLEKIIIEKMMAAKK